MKKSKQKKILKKSDEITLPEYEKIGNLTLKLESWGVGLLSWSILFIIIGSALVFLFSYPPTSEIEDPIQFYFTFATSIGLICLGFVLLILSLIVVYLSIGYESFRKYNANLVIYQYFRELSENPDRNRKNEILKHLHYNLWKIELPYDMHGQRFFLSQRMKYFLSYRSHMSKFISMTLNNLLVFLKNSDIFVKNNDFKQIYIDIGNCFKKDRIDYVKLAQIMKNKKKLFSEIEKLQEEIKTKTFKEKIGDFSHWFSIHGRTIIYASAVILLILYALGKFRYLFYLRKIKLYTGYF